jgi:hypothetical protein
MRHHVHHSSNFSVLTQNNKPHITQEASAAPPSEKATTAGSDKPTVLFAPRQ